jgi:transcription initiation factor TFIIIB Brf1 subunit/transcription initiation factor TFIIB
MDLSYLTIELNCPKCNFLVEVILKQVTAEETILCPGCLIEIQLIDEGKSVERAQHDIDEALNDYFRSL